jgi:DNA gyrase subunit A
MITCKSGVTIRMKVADISEQGRATQGVKLIRLDNGDEIAAITKLEDQEDNEEPEVISDQDAPASEGGDATQTGEEASTEGNPEA